MKTIFSAIIDKTQDTVRPGGLCCRQIGSSAHTHEPSWRPSCRVVRSYVAV